jgi:hypothetical protein
MQFCLATATKGLFFQPTTAWSGDKKFKFKILGRSDSDFAKQVENRRSVSGYSVFLQGCAVATKSKTQHCVTLSVCEAELVAAVECAQTMLFVRNILLGMGLEVELPMVLEIDCKGTVDLNNNWSVGGRTRHIPVKYMFLRDLKEEGLFDIIWIPTETNSSDLFTKNLVQRLFGKHQPTYVR